MDISQLDAESLGMGKIRTRVQAMQIKLLKSFQESKMLCKTINSDSKEILINDELATITFTRPAYGANS